MRDFVVCCVGLLTALSTVWVIVYGFFVAWYRSIYGQMLMLLMFSLWVSLIASLHDMLAEPELDWRPGIGIPISVIMSFAIGGSLVVMIRDNFFRKEIDDDEQSCETCPVPESARRCPHCAGDLGIGSKR